MSQVDQANLTERTFWAGFIGATTRNNIRLSRNSASLVSAFVIPGLFMLSFWAVFGHAANKSGFDYALFLTAACMFQAVMFTAGGSAMALGVDEESGLLDRMRAMPISAVAIIGGRLTTDVLRSFCSVAAVITLGLLCGAKPAGWLEVLVAVTIALLMGMVLGLFFSGLTLRSRHPVQMAGLIQAIEMPLLMMSTAFIPVETLPAWLRPIIKHMPFSPLIDSTRAVLAGNEMGDLVWEAAAWLISGLVVGTWWVARSFRRQQ